MDTLLDLSMHSPSPMKMTLAMLFELGKKIALHQLVSHLTIYFLRPSRVDRARGHISDIPWVCELKSNKIKHF